MRQTASPKLSPSFELPLVLLFLFMLVLFLAGGASRGDVWGQTVVRGAAWGALIVALLFGPRPSAAGLRSVFWLAGAAVALVLLHLLPLPPALWQALPRRAAFVEATMLAGETSLWRPLAVVPGGALNAAGALVVPIVTLMLLAMMAPVERARFAPAILGIVLGAGVLGLLQFSGGGWNNPLINDIVGEVSGSFANRNHFAMFMAFGCILAPTWAFMDHRRPGWRGLLALLLVPFFILLILASGSRAGIVLGLVATALGLLIVRGPVRQMLSRRSKWAFPVSLGAIIVALVVFVAIAVMSDRAVSIRRIFDIDLSEDLRGRTLPTLWAIAVQYFPLGYGLGGFDQIFRMNEPFELLRFEYLNLAHNDFLQIFMEAGLPGLALLVIGMAWWGVTSIRVWRKPGSSANMLARAGSAMLLLVFIASLVDYPARTPMMMAIIVIAAAWLSHEADGSRRTALPK